MKDFVTRINLKTDTKDRKKLIDVCLNNKDEQYVAIGWSYIYDSNSSKIKNYMDYYYAVKEDVSRLNTALNLFKDVEINDLFWTRDLDGVYWICRAKSEAEPKYDSYLDIGAVVPVEAYQVGMQVPGIIKASFNRPRGGIVHRIYDEFFYNYSKYVFNKESKKEVYKNILKEEGSIIDKLDAFDLEELVISYIQIKDNYYLLSSSVARKSTTIKIECEFISRDKTNPKKAVVQVKGGDKEINALEYNEFVKKGYDVYLYAGGGVQNKDENYIVITKSDLEKFYEEYNIILPKSITSMEKLFV